MATRKNLHLLISAIIIIIIALVYGLFPKNILPLLFDFKVETTDLNNVFKATMGLYIAMTILWLTGIFRPSYWRTATLSNIFFMLGLAVGRVISLLVDGVPSIWFLAGLALELALGLWGVRNLMKYRSSAAR